jgi:peptidoglycan/xylan/chitin deacetylase (PgdA/CDA1 family)
MDRRRFLVTLAAGLVGAAAAHGAAGLGSADAVPVRRPARLDAARPVAATAAAPAVTPVPAPTGEVSRLPGTGTALALTIDDGTSSEVVAAYVALARRTGLRLTFFPNGCYGSWADNARALRPLIESGQVAIGNHTWSHPDLTTLPDAAIADQLTRNRTFLRRTLGVRDTPFFRPPYGAHDARVDRIAADLGHPTVALWYGTLGDDTVISSAEILANARKWFHEQRIVIGHANHTPVTAVLDQLHRLIADRHLRTVTLADVWSTPPAGAAGRSASGAAARSAPASASAPA